MPASFSAATIRSGTNRVIWQEVLTFGEQQCGAAGLDRERHAFGRRHLAVPVDRFCVVPGLATLRRKVSMPLIHEIPLLVREIRGLRGMPEEGLEPPDTRIMIPTVIRSTEGEI